MATRKELREQKEKTSMALITAALELCAEEGYASLSLRKVAQKAGIAPTSFYRHFREIDELGVAIIVKAGTVLDESLSRIRGQMKFPAVTERTSPQQLRNAIEYIIRPFTEIFMESLETHNHLLHLFFQEQTGSSEVMRNAISQEMNRLIESLTADLEPLFATSGIGIDTVRFISETMIKTAGHMGIEMRVAPGAERRQVVERLIRTLGLFLLGATIQDRIEQGKEKI